MTDDDRKAQDRLRAWQDERHAYEVACDVCGASFRSAGTIGEALAGVDPSPDDGRGGCCSAMCMFRGFSRRMAGKCIRCEKVIDPPDPRERFCAEHRASIKAPATTRIYVADEEAAAIVAELRAQPDTSEVLVKKIHGRRRDGKWDLTLCERLDGWWLILANRDGGGVHEYLFRPDRGDDARESFLVDEEELDRIHGTPAGETLQ